MKYGFVKVAAAVPAVKVADVDYNVQQIESIIAQAEGRGVEVIVFPELCITGYTCQDLFKEQLLLDRAEGAIITLLDFTRKLNIISIVGLPVIINGLLYNCAAVIQGGQILGVIPKTYLPNYAEFYEKRWFASAQDLNPSNFYFAGTSVSVSAEPKLFVTSSGMKFGVEICEDVWAPIPPSNNLALSGADIIFNLSASNELIGKHAYLKSLLAQQSARTISGYVYASSGFGESTQDLVFGGHRMIAENGTMLAESERFLNPDESSHTITEIDVSRLATERRKMTTFPGACDTPEGKRYLTVPFDLALSETPLSRTYDPHPFVPSDPAVRARRCEEILNIQTLGLVKRLSHIHAGHVVLGISGGLDSTLALLVCVRAFDRLKLPRRNILAVTMPCFGTTNRTYTNACSLVRETGAELREINIEKAVRRHFSDIGQDPEVHDAAYENSQARERTQILMDLANQNGGIVIGTGDLSESALGWATYNGDHMSMYGVNATIPKTLVRYLIDWYAGSQSSRALEKTLRDILDTPVSPELLPPTQNGTISQKTEDLVGPYELHDFFLYYLLRAGFAPHKIRKIACLTFQGRYDEETIDKWLHVFCRRFFSQQFKRSCMPDGPKVGSVALSPRGDLRMPSDASAAAWLKDLDR